MAKASIAKKHPSERWSLPASQARSRATRERLLEAAENVFARKGYAGAKIADIAEDAGCSVGAVYFRFKDKDALFFAIAESFIEEARAGLSVLFGETTSGDAERIIRKFVAASAESFRKHRGLFRAIVERGFDHPLAMKTIFGFREATGRGALEHALCMRGRMPSLRDPRDDADGLRVSYHRRPQQGCAHARSATSAQPIAGLADACVAYLKSGKSAR